MRRRLRWVAAWTAATLLLWLAFRAVAWTDVWRTLAGARAWWIAGALAANFCILLLWSRQWRLFCPRPVSPSRMFEVTTVMATVANSVPFLAGQAAGVHLLATRGGTGHAPALSVLALDQLAEGLAKVSVLALLALLVPLPAELKASATVVAVGVGALAVALAVAARWGGTAIKVAGTEGTPARERFEDRRRDRRGRADAVGRERPIRDFGRRFALGLQALRRPGTFAGGFGLALAMKGAEGGAIVAVQAALGVQLPLWATVLVLASVGLATMVAVAPANLGVYEASAFAAYRLAGVDPETAAALALLQHAAYLLPLAGTGWLVVGFAGVARARETAASA